jgi:hypothetical protein
VIGVSLKERVMNHESPPAKRYRTDALGALGDNFHIDVLGPADTCNLSLKNHYDLPPSPVAISQLEPSYVSFFNKFQPFLIVSLSKYSLHGFMQGEPVSPDR